MKKLFAAAAGALFLFTSCSEVVSSDDTNVKEVLLKKKIEQYQDGLLLTTLYDYDGTKIKSISQSDGQRMEFFYTGDQITEVEHFETGGQVQTTEFTYDAEGRIIEMLEYGIETVPGEEGEDPTPVPWADRTTFTFNADGTVSLIKYSGDHESQTEVTEEGTLTIANGNITAYTSASGNSSYTFDGANNAELNITGITPLNIAWQYGGINNVTGATRTNGPSYTATFTYNSKDYPVSATEIEDGQTTQIWFMY
jgi:YD repeat-containing protein